MKRGTYKPCPGCGENNYRPTDDVCSTCRRTLDRARDFSDLQKSLPDGIVIVEYAPRAYWNEHIYTNGDMDKRLGSKIMEKFFDLAVACSTPTNNHNAEFELLGKMSSGSREWAQMQRAVAVQIRDLYKLIQQALKNQYEAGKQDGHNLLMRLAQGDLSANEWLEKTEN